MCAIPKMAVGLARKTDYVHRCQGKSFVFTPFLYIPLDLSPSSSLSPFCLLPYRKNTNDFNIFTFTKYICMFAYEKPSNFIDRHALYFHPHRSRNSGTYKHQICIVITIFIHFSRLSSSPQSFHSMCLLKRLERYDLVP